MTGYLSVRAVIEAVSGVTGIPYADIVGPRRMPRFVRARQVAMYFAHRYCRHLSVAEIGRRMGARDHTTILYGVGKIEAEVAEKGMDATMQAIDLVLAPALDVVEKLDIAEPDPDPLAIAERAIDGYAVARLSYSEIRVLGEFVLHAVKAGRLVADPPDDDSANVGIIGAARRVVTASRALATARYGTGERLALDGLLAAIGDLGAAYAAEVGPIPAPQPTFKTALNPSRKEASHGHA